MTTQHARSIIPPLPVVPKHLGPTDSDMETLADHTVEVRQQRVEIQLPKDRPFGNLVSPNSMLPQNYATIFQARVEPVEKARRLRLALRQDNFQLAAYTCMLSFLATLAGFQWAGGALTP